MRRERFKHLLAGGLAAAVLVAVPALTLAWWGPEVWNALSADPPGVTASAAEGVAADTLPSDAPAPAGTASRQTSVLLTDWTYTNGNGNNNYQGNNNWWNNYQSNWYNSCTPCRCGGCCDD